MASILATASLAQLEHSPLETPPVCPVLQCCIALIAIPPLVLARNAMLGMDLTRPFKSAVLVHLGSGLMVSIHALHAHPLGLALGVSLAVSPLVSVGNALLVMVSRMVIVLLVLLGIGVMEQS